MTGLVALFFLLAVLFVVLGLADPRRLYWSFTAWRYRNPAANEPSDGAYTAQRVVFFVVAAVLAFQGFRSLDVVDDTSWSDDELRRAVRHAATSLEQEPHLDDPFDDYASLIEQEVRDAGEGDGPPYDVQAEAAGEGDGYMISAQGADATFCMHVSKSTSKKGGMFVPGAGDNPGTVVPEYVLEATVDAGDC